MQTIVSAEELRKRGYPVRILTARGTPAEAEALRLGFPVDPILPTGYFSPVALWKVVSTFKKHEIRIVHTEYSRDLWTLVPAARLAGGQRVFFTQGMASSVDKKDWFHSWIYRNTEKVLAISNMIVENLLKRYPLDRGKIVLLHRGVDLEKFRFDADARREIRQEFDIPEGAATVGLVGRLTRGKGHLTFLRACAKAARGVEEARFLVIGPPSRGEEEYHRQLKALAEELSLEKRLAFTGFRKDVPKLLSALDLLVVPSKSEALGNTAIEGMATSLPVVAAGSAGLLDIVEEGVCGSFFPPGDHEALAATMIALLRNPELRRKMGSAARRRAVDRFDRSKRTDRIEELYARSLGLRVQT